MIPGETMRLILSLFPGIDLLGRGFELEGFCVVRGPDTIYGGDVRTFHVPPGKFDGYIGGPPCQEFSSENRNPDLEKGISLLREYLRLVEEGKPDWFLLENVTRVPDVRIDGYTIQRFDLNARECGLRQSRQRHFQYGSKQGYILVPERIPPVGAPEPICLASEGSRQDRRGFAEFCELQGLPRDFELPGWSTEQKYRAVGNGVPVPMARIIARAIISARIKSANEHLCACGCGRICNGKQIMATAACRKRMQRRREQSRLIVSL